MHLKSEPSTNITSKFRRATICETLVWFACSHDYETWLQTQTILPCCVYAAAFGDAVGMAQFCICPCSLVSLICNIIWISDPSASFNPGVCLSTIPMLVFGECVGKSHCMFWSMKQQVPSLSKVVVMIDYTHVTQPKSIPLTSLQSIMRNKSYESSLSLPARTPEAHLHSDSVWTISLLCKKTTNPGQ